jgi:hypothetical protein
VQAIISGAILYTVSTTKGVLLSLSNNQEIQLLEASVKLGNKLLSRRPNDNNAPSIHQMHNDGVYNSSTHTFVCNTDINREIQSLLIQFRTTQYFTALSDHFFHKCIAKGELASAMRVSSIFKALRLHIAQLIYQTELQNKTSTI